MSVFLTLIWLSNTIPTLFATNHTSDESYATLQPDIRPIVLTFLPPDYDLPQNIYDWNVTEIVSYINDKDPELLYTIDTSLLFTVFPEYFIQGLPRDILIAHKLYAYLPINDPLYCFNITNCTATPIISTIDACFGPFVNTKYDGVFVFPNGSDSYQCGLRCEHTQILYGVNDEEMSLIDTFNWIFCLLFLMVCIVIWINICMDIKFSKQRCIRRPFLFHAPICIVLNYTIVSLCFLLPLIIGKDTITCADDIDDVKTFGSYNPGSSNWCTVMGLIFYFAELSVGAYTLFFSIGLWRQFTGALRSLLKDCKCCNVTNKCLDKLTVSKAVTHKKSVTDVANESCFQTMRSRTILAHVAIYLFVIIYTLTGFFDQAIGSIPPLGICAVGTLGNGHAQYIAFQIVPLSIISILSTLFLPAAIILLIHIAKHSKSTNIKFQFGKLKARLLVYFICVQIAWFGVVFLICIFHFERPKFEIAAENRTKCMLLNSGSGTTSKEIFMDECMHGYTYWAGYYVIVGLTLPLAAFGSAVLSCGQHNRSRWKIISGYCLFRDAATANEKMLKQLGNVVESTGNAASVTKTDNTDLDVQNISTTGATTMVTVSDASDKEKGKNGTLVDLE